jgi:hypothetical protein
VSHQDTKVGCLEHLKIGWSRSKEGLWQICDLVANRNSINPVELLPTHRVSHVRLFSDEANRGLTKGHGITQRGFLSVVSMPFTIHSRIWGQANSNQVCKEDMECEKELNLDQGPCGVACVHKIFD